MIAQANTVAYYPQNANNSGLMGRDALAPNAQPNVQGVAAAATGELMPNVSLICEWWAGREGAGRC